LYRCPHAAPFYNTCCSSCDWSGQSFCNDTYCTGRHTPIKPGNLL